jgi:hypothetical protein
MTTPPPARTIDFDAFRREQKSEPITILIDGESYQIGSDMPAAVALEVIALRQQIGDDADVAPEKIGELATSLFGEELLNTLVTKHRLTTPELAVLVVQVFGEYSKGIDPNPKARVKRASKKASSSA